MSQQLKKTNSGLKIEGELEDIAEFARKVEKTLQETEIRDESIEGFNDWRPREEDSKKDIERKTINAATLSRKELEEESQGIKEDFSKAGNNAAKAGKRMKNVKNPGYHLVKASKEFLKPVYSVSAKMIRRLEEKVYSGVMVKFNPYFFDAKEFSADLRHDEEKYSMDLNIPKESHRTTIKERFEGRSN